MHLAFEPAEELQQCLAERLVQYTDHTITNSSILAEQLKEVATVGYAIDNGEHLRDVHSVAVPIKDYTKAVVGSLTISGPAYRVHSERLQSEIIPLVIKAGRELSSRLGYNG